MTKKVKLPITQAEEMRKYFALNNIKNKDIAEMLNVSPAAISNMLAGRDSIGMQRAFALHDAYGFDVTFLLTGVGSLIPGEGNAYAAPESKAPGHEDAPGIPAGAVAHGWLDGWVTEEYSPTTRNTFLVSISAIFLQAQRDGLVSSNPLAALKRKTVQTRKRSLSREQFRTLWDAEPRGRGDTLALDLFKASFLMIAANPVDISRMTEKSIVNGRIEYDRAKTGKHYSIAVVPELSAVLEPYRKRGALFAPLHKVQYTGTANYLNRHLRQLAERLGLPPVTFYWARHSWASFAAELDIPVEVISSALGHSHGSAVTLVYIAIDLRKVDRAHRQVIDYALGDK